MPVHASFPTRVPRVGQQQNAIVGGINPSHHATIGVSLHDNRGNRRGGSRRYSRWFFQEKPFLRGSNVSAVIRATICRRSGTTSHCP